MSPFMVTICVIVALLLKLGGQLLLEVLNLRHVASHASQLPPIWRGIIPPDSYAKSTQYTVSKAKFAIVAWVFDAGVVAAVLLSGLLPWLYDQVTQKTGAGIIGQAMFMACTVLLLSAVDIPLSLWRQFRLEQRFGFNRSTLALWVADRAKGLLLSALIGIPVLCVVLWFIQRLDSMWWIAAFAVIATVQLTLTLIFPRWILPLFNRLTPLPEGELRDRLRCLADRTGFRIAGVFVMDGSKRSTHSNAFFTGFGRFRRIVLFDTLIDQCSTDEIEAVLAHEIGHSKHGHVYKGLLVSAGSTLAGLWVASVLIDSPVLYTSFALPVGAHGAGLLLLGMLSAVVLFWLTPLATLMSRRYEFQADRFAAVALGGSDALVRALRCLHTKNLSNLTPHPVYSAFYYSHPTLVEREKALRRIVAGAGSDEGSEQEVGAEEGRLSASHDVRHE